MATKEERIEALEEKMDVLDSALCSLGDVAVDLEDANESALLKKVNALEEAVQERCDELDEKRSELEE